MSHLKSVFMPMWPQNPYHKLLIDYLDKLGVQVEGAGLGAIFLPTALTQWKPDILHLHETDYPLATAKNSWVAASKVAVFLSELAIMKLMGVKIVWTAHDLKNHENKYPKLNFICTSFIARLAQKIFVHSETAKREVAQKFKLKSYAKFSIIPHGNYINYYENKVDQTEARKRLGISETAFVFLFLGQIRPYKGVPELIEAFNRLPYDDVRLVIAGKPSSEELNTLIAQTAATNHRVQFISGFVPDDKIQVYMNACDTVVMPYRDILTSGSVVLAMSFGKACISPRKGCIVDVLDDAGAFLYDSDAEAGLLQALELAVKKRAELPKMGDHNRALAEQWPWHQVADLTLDVYKDCMSGSQ